MTLATSKNLTIVGICMIIGALAAAATAIFDGDAATNVNWETTIAALVTGFGFVMSKGAQTTGGTVDPAGNPVPPQPVAK